MYVVRLLCQVPEARADFAVGAVLCCAVLCCAVYPGSACASLCPMLMDFALSQMRSRRCGSCMASLFSRSTPHGTCPSVVHYPQALGWSTSPSSGVVVPDTPAVVLAGLTDAPLTAEHVAAPPLPNTLAVRPPVPFPHPTLISAPSLTTAHVLRAWPPCVPNCEAR